MATTAVELGERFFAVYHRVHKTAHEQMAASGLSLPRTKSLAVIAEEGPIRPRAMAQRFDCAAASVTDMIDGLERDGLAERHPDPTDRRASLVTITEAGTTALATARVRRTEILDAIFGVLGDEDRDALLAVLDTLAGNSIVNGVPA